MEPNTSTFSGVIGENNIENSITMKPTKFSVDKTALKIVNSNEKMANSYNFDGHLYGCCNSRSKKLDGDLPQKTKMVKKSLRKDVRYLKHSTALPEKVPKQNRVPKFCLRNRSNAIPIKSNINISSDFLQKNTSHLDDQSNMFLYIDLHGHASKKGIFMYGNHLPNISEAVECMLLPRLMSLNCQHFHFDACVFSEKNMYHKYELEKNIKIINLWLSNHSF